MLGTVKRVEYVGRWNSLTVEQLNGGTIEGVNG